jgi:hypothetical protein
MAKKTVEEKLRRQLKDANRNLKRALPHIPNAKTIRVPPEVKRHLQHTAIWQAHSATTL